MTWGLALLIMVTLATPAVAWREERRYGTPEGQVYRIDYEVDDTTHQQAQAEGRTPERYPATITVYEVQREKTALVVPPFQGWWAPDGPGADDPAQWVEQAERMRRMKRNQEVR